MLYNLDQFVGKSSRRAYILSSNLVTGLVTNSLLFVLINLIYFLELPPSFLGLGELLFLKVFCILFSFISIYLDKRFSFSRRLCQ